MEHDSPKRGKLYLWLDERIGLSDFAKLAKKKEVPLHRHTFWYYFGGMTLFSVHDSGRHRHSAVALLSPQRRRGFRVDPVHHDRGRSSVGWCARFIPGRPI